MKLKQLNLNIIEFLQPHDKNTLIFVEIIKFNYFFNYVITFIQISKNKEKF